MTNEELALKIQQGDDGLLPELWEQVRRLIVMFAQRYHKNYCLQFKQNTTVFEVDDLIQQGYFAVLKAVKTYDPDKGMRFSSYLVYFLKTAFREASGIMRYEQALAKASKEGSETSKIYQQRIYSLLDSISLDAPLQGSDGDLNLLDAIGNKKEFPEGVEDLIIESVNNQELRAALDDAMNILTEKQRETLVLHYYFSLSLEKLAEIRGCSRETINNQRFNALSRIYNSRHRKILAEFLSSREPRNPYKATGYQAWRRNLCSQQEMFLIGWRKKDDNPATHRQQNTDCEGNAHRDGELATCCASE